MSKIAELAYDIEQLYIDGLSARQISRQLECPVDQVLAFLDSIGVEDIEPVSKGEAVFRNMVEELSPFETMNS
jgi:hypothetical protein